MKKSDLFIPVFVLAAVLACFLVTGHNRRDEISDIMARQISVDESSGADLWISSSDTAYNWVHRSLDFSIGINSETEEKVSVVFVFTENGNQKTTVHTAQKKLNPEGETIFHASVSDQKFSSGEWMMSAYLIDQNHQRIPLRNQDASGSDVLAVCTFHVR